MNLDSLCISSPLGKTTLASEFWLTRACYCDKLWTGKNIMSSIILPAFETFRKKKSVRPTSTILSSSIFLCVIIGCSVWGPLYSPAGVGGACHATQILVLETLQPSDLCSISHLPHVSLLLFSVWGETVEHRNV